MSDITDEMLYGKNAADLIKREKQFNVELKSINEKYKDFFEGRPLNINTGEHDTLMKHCFTRNDGGVVSFNFMDDIVPKYIQEECVELFKKHFPGAK